MSHDDVISGGLLSPFTLHTYRTTMQQHTENSAENDVEDGLPLFKPGFLCFNLRVMLTIAHASCTET